ncbi:MAG: hypothetical protein ACKVP0_07430 [Pirellulaceae bacterium]
MKRPALKIVITDIHEGICDKCEEPVIGYQAKLENFSGLLCGSCLQDKWNRRKEAQEAAERPLLKEETLVAASAGSRKSA